MAWLGARTAAAQPADVMPEHVPSPSTTAPATARSPLPNVTPPPNDDTLPPPVRSASSADPWARYREPEPEPEEDEPLGVDPLLPVGLSLTTLAAFNVAVGASNMSDDREPEMVCGVSGACLETAPDDGGGLAGITLLSAGIGAGVIGLTSTAVASYRSAVGSTTPPLLVTGTWMLGVGAYTGTFGVVALANDAGDAPPFVASILIGGLGVAGGTSLLIAGAVSDDDSYEPRSMGQLSSGIALATAGVSIAPFVIGICHATTQSTGEYAGLATVAVCVPGVLASLGMAGAGFALWSVGGRHEPEATVSLGMTASGLGLEGTW